MRRLLVLVAALALLPAVAQGQLADRKVLTIAAVKQIMNAAEAEAVRNGWNVSIAIVDEHGELMAFRRMDGTSFASIDISQGKARTAARLRRPTKMLADGLAAGNLAFLTAEGMVALQGGLPITIDGVVVGGIGVSGVTSAQDEQVAAAGVAAARP